MHLSRRDLYKLTALGAAPVALAACSQASNLETGEEGDDRPIINCIATEGSLTKNFNPHSPSVIHMIQGLIYETLFYFNPLEAIDQEPVPLLGESYEWNEAGTVLTVTIREGVTWTDATEFTAADVAFTFNNVRDTEALNPGGTAPSAEAVDDLTVEITYAEPSFTEGPNALARTWIIPEHLFADVEDLATYANEEPVGTGPFVYDDFTAESYLLRTNDAYWDGGRPDIGGGPGRRALGNEGANARARTPIIPEHLFADVEALATYANEEPVATGPFVYDDSTAESYLLRTNDAYWDEGRPAIGGVRVSTTSGNQAATDMWL